MAPLGAPCGSLGTASAAGSVFGSLFTSVSGSASAPGSGFAWEALAKHLRGIIDAFGGNLGVL